MLNGELRLFDLHCDTLYEACKQHKGLFSNDLSLSFERLSEYRRYCQVLAVWSDPKVSEDGSYRAFFAAREKLLAELAPLSGPRLCVCGSELCETEKLAANGVFLAVEGGRLLSDDISRLDELHAAGVRFLTLVWDKVCRLGGAHDTDEGLTPFGREVVLRCFELGIIPDVSHASARMCDEVIELAREYGRVCIATHSNSYSICAHRRNLTDERFKAIAKLGGVVGISLAPMHLTSSEHCTVDDVARHIEHYLSLGGENAVCLGCDLDGVARLPEGIKTVSDLHKIAEKLAKINYKDSLIDKIFYANARNFIYLWLNQ